MIVYVFISLLIDAICGAPVPTENYANKLILVKPDIYVLYWNYTENDILFETHVKNLGWSAFGISPNGGMPNSDVIVSWVNPDGSIHFTDRHISSDNEVLVDSKQDWYPLLIKQIGEYTLTKFTRKINLCDESKEDLDIPEGTPFIIFSWNPKLTGGDISYHGKDKRGQKTVPLISSLNLKVDLDQEKLESKEFRVNVRLQKTTHSFFYLTIHLFFLISRQRLIM